MHQYLAVLDRALLYGERKVSRGYHTRALFAETLYFDLQEGFPLVTTKRVSFHNVKHELLWMLRGDVHLDYLHEHNVHIWDQWAKPDGTIGPGYGFQWRHWPEAFQEDLMVTYDAGTIDQVAEVVRLLRHDPGSRRMVVNAWNVAYLSRMALPPCHLVWIANVNRGAVNVHVTLRSIDLFVGLPYNIAFYALLVHLLAHVSGLLPGALSMSLVDAHLYEDHVAAAQTQLARVPYRMPSLVVRDDTPTDLFAIRGQHIALEGYQSHPAIPVPVME